MWGKLGKDGPLPGGDYRPLGRRSAPGASAPSDRARARRGGRPGRVRTGLLAVGALVLPAFASLVVGCRRLEPTVFPTTLTDVYIQEPLRMVDVLLVIDNSGSMEEEQARLSRNFEAFIQAFVDAKVNYHVGVITTDLRNQEQAGRLVGDVRYITPETPDAAEVFASNVQVGTNGSGLEMGLEAAGLALSEPLVSTYNAGFLRDGASLSIVVFSDEDDMSPGSVNDYLNFFASLKGDRAYRDHTLMNVSAVVGDVPFGCEAPDGTGEAGAGTRYYYAAQATAGVTASICAGDFTPIVEALGLDLSGLREEFPLTRCARPDTLEVIVEGRLEEQGVAYTYLPDARAVRFAPGWVPGPLETIEISYEYYPENQPTCPAGDGTDTP